MTTNNGAVPAMAGSAKVELRSEPTALPVRRFGIGHQLFGWHPMGVMMPARVSA